MEPIDHTFKLAQFLAQLKYEHLPKHVIAQAKRSILNSLGCGAGSCHAPPVEKVIETVLLTPHSSSAGGQCTILGRSERACQDTVALINGVALTAADYDDTHLRTVIHPSGTPLAALLSWAELHHLSGRDFILAFVAGVEAQCAIGNALGPSHYKDGWHITGTAGHFGAAAAIAKALKLDSTQYAAALGHAASMAGGIRAMFGTDTKTLHMGRAAQNGILAANLAAHGFGSCARSIESWLRLVSTTVEEGELSALAGEGEGEGEGDWQILQNTFKPYPCGIVIHPLIDGCLEAYEQLHSMDEPGEESLCERIVSIDVVVNPQCVRLCSVRHPKNGLETIFSLYHGCAVALVSGRAGPAEFSDDMASENVQVASTRDKVNVRTDGEVRDDEAYLTIKYKCLGETGILESSFHIEHATGSLARPMTLEQLERKFLDQASPVLGSDKAVRTAKACWNLEDMGDIADLVKLLVP
ncbi:hypothetical protein LTR55_008333 [Exophiala xenobiotica]|nr:hypothetical protein LTR14_008592 [Exophiala xenobiotica]KAK5477741.1 hypothetical protein LTR55_008333 [Exophiala xenobiotica]